MWLKCSLVLFILSELGICIVPSILLTDSYETSSRFQWSGLKSSPDLRYEDCYDGFECAKLSVPLDWKNSSNPNRVSLAVVRLPATVPEDDPRHGGSIILNPGGPGGPGTLYAVQAAGKIQKLLDGPKHYEIVSFDPRGVFFSTPNAFCFDSASEAEIWAREKRAVGRLDRGKYALRYHWATEKGRGRLCAGPTDGVFENGDNVRRYVSTAFVARDMLELVEKIEERKAAKFQTSTLLYEQDFVDKGQATVSNAKLQYIGVSYGTFLGQTFASMYPDKVGRMILDGNIDGDNWVSRYEASVDENEAIRQYFFEECFAASSQCGIWHEEDHGPKDIERRYESIARSLEAEPVSANTDGHPIMITSDELSQGFFTATYQPLVFFKIFAELLNDLHLGREPARLFWRDPVPGTDAGVDEVTSHVLHNPEVGTAIHCSDGPDFSNATLDQFTEYLNDLVDRFPYAGAIQADYKIPCWSWPKALRTTWRYDGPFNGTVPILFVNNKLDPATPLRNAKKMSKRFEGSGLVIHNRVGHGALFPATDCMWQHARRYMQQGEMPPEGNVCDSECGPFDDDCTAEYSHIERSIK